MGSSPLWRFFRIMDMTAGYKSIDMDTWPRRECYDYYATGSKCMCAISADIDVTDLYRKAVTAKKNFEVAVLYVITNVLNRHEEFRVGYCKENGRLMIWDYINPVHRVFHEDTEMFSRIWTKYDTDFTKFYIAALHNITEGLKLKTVNQPEIPENNFEISFIPWLHFSAINTKMSESGKYLAPVITVGKVEEINGKFMMPFTMQISHAVADGFHIARAFNETAEESKKLAASL
jgi:chloramphenicol O-acetyltransferase type A